MKRKSREVKVTIMIEGKEIPLNPFVRSIIQKTILGMVSSLKGVNIEGNEQIVIEIKRRKE